MISMLTQAMLEKSASELYFVPASITYDKVVEESIYLDTNGVDSINLRSFEYNDLGQLESETRADYGEIRMKYDNSGNNRFMQNDKRLAEETFVYFKYDDFGRKVGVQTATGNLVVAGSVRATALADHNMCSPPIQPRNKWHALSFRQI